MATRTVRLDDEAERMLAEIQRVTDLSVSDALKQGLRAVRGRLEEEVNATPYEVYLGLELGPRPRGRSSARAERAKQLVRAAIRRKHRR